MSQETAASGEVAGEEALSQTDANRLHEARKKILAELGKIIVGQEDVIDEIIICLFSRGHLDWPKR
jgi:MoxR-like ATPase